MIYVANKAFIALNRNLYNDVKVVAKGYYKDRENWVAFDNSSGDCFVEEFKEEKKAMAWVNNCFEISSDEKVSVIKVLPNLYYIYNKGFLKIIIKNEIMRSKFIPFKVFQFS